MDLQENYSLKGLNSFGLEVNTKRYGLLKSKLDVVEYFSKESSDSTMFLGGGSNVLFTSDYQGTILHNQVMGIEVIEESEDFVWIRIGSGENWHHLVQHCVANNYGGIENLSLIPGTVGAAPMQNIGAYGVEIKDVFVELEAIDLLSGKEITFSNEECEFGYRDSIFKKALKNKCFISGITLRLTRNNHEISTSYGDIQQTLEDMGIENPGINDVSRAVIHIRESKLPDPKDIGNAGSFFKNPVIDNIDYEGLKLEFTGIPSYPVDKLHKKVPAAWLIDQCDWKGYRNGDIGVHEKQALVLVNYGNGKGADILELSEQIRESVSRKFGIELEREVNVV